MELSDPAPWLCTCIRVPTSSGNHGKSQIKIPCMEKSWNLIKAEKSWNFVKSIVKVTAIGNSTLKSVKGQEKLVQKNHLHVIDMLH